MPMAKKSIPIQKEQNAATKPSVACNVPKALNNADIETMKLIISSTMRILKTLLFLFFSAALRLNNKSNTSTAMCVIKTYQRSSFIYID